MTPELEQQELLLFELNIAQSLPLAKNPCLSLESKELARPSISRKGANKHPPPALEHLIYSNSPLRNHLLYFSLLISFVFISRRPT